MATQVEVNDEEALPLQVLVESLSPEERNWLTKSEHQMATRLRELMDQWNSDPSSERRANIVEKLSVGFAMVRSSQLDRGGLRTELMVRHTMVLTFTEADWERVRASTHPLLIRVCELLAVYVEGVFSGDEASLFDHLVTGTYYAYREGLLATEAPEGTAFMAPDLADWWKTSSDIKLDSPDKHLS